MHECCCTYCWILESHGNADEMVQFRDLSFCARGSEMILFNNWLLALKIARRNNANARGFDFTLSIGRFLFEDISQAVIQVIYLFQTNHEICNFTSSEAFVFGSIVVALILSFTRTVKTLYAIGLTRIYRTCCSENKVLFAILFCCGCKDNIELTLEQNNSPTGSRKSHMVD